MRRRMRLMLVSVMMLLVWPAPSFLAAPGGLAQAEVYNCDTASHYFDGYWQPYGQGTAEGAAADIVTRYGAVCDTDTGRYNRVAAWAMVANGNSHGWVQSGYIRWYNHQSVFFTQISETGTAYDTKFGTGSLTYGNTNHYDEIWNSSCSCEHTKIDGTVWDHTTFNPFNAWNWPFSPQFLGEATYKQNDMPGNSANPTYFENPQHQSTGTDNWVSYGCNTLAKSNDLAGYTRTDGESWYDEIATNCPNFKIYTDTAGS